MDAMRCAVLHGFARQFTRSTQQMRQDAQLQVFFQPILLCLRDFVLLVVEEEDFVVSALVQNILIDTLLIYCIFSVNFELNGIGHVE